MSRDDPALAALIGSRICHDLASPLGAVANGLELLALSGKDGGADMALLEDSLRGARAVLDLARLAFGVGGPGEDMAAARLQAILAAYCAGKPRLSLDWQLCDAMPRARAQIVMLTCLAMEQALPRGGLMIVAQAGREVRITGQGEGLMVDQEMWDAVTGASALPRPDPRHAQFHMLRSCLVAEGLSLTLLHEGDRLQATV